MQRGVPLAMVQTLPQPPQFETEVFVSTSHPSMYVLLQLPRPATQVAMPHVALVQVYVATLGALQGRPHWPQWATVELVSTSQPST